MHFLVAQLGGVGVIFMSFIFHFFYFLYKIKEGEKQGECEEGKQTVELKPLDPAPLLSRAPLPGPASRTPPKKINPSHAPTHPHPFPVPAMSEHKEEC